MLGKNDLINPVPDSQLFNEDYYLRPIPTPRFQAQAPPNTT